MGGNTVEPTGVRSGAAMESASTSRPRPFLWGVWIASFVLVAVLVAPVAILDGPMGIFGVLLFQPDTEYSNGYSDWKFLKLKQGMSASEVQALLGAPLRVTEFPKEHEQVWFYSRSPHDTHYRCRVVEFRDSVVAKIHTEFYVD